MVLVMMVIVIVMMVVVVVVMVALSYVACAGVGFVDTQPTHGE
jgi:hypothetical protein